ncbi:glutamate racemase [Psychrobacter sp. ENNN9_III]|uniref:glutamate racemase n=1 Tax=Psychrobacter sp. ENNN9_III TaxID=1254334 RepID=UPI0009EB00ED|nr:glutamate racemase [Psychrobacter sp. ENNN9_III]
MSTAAPVLSSIPDRLFTNPSDITVDLVDCKNDINHKNDLAPIGLFDSGVGGLSVYLHLAQQLPSERYIYYADTLHVPYGNRESQDIKELTLTAVEWLYQRGCKLIVIACNSASAHGLEAARQHYPNLPIVGLVPALKPAVIASKSGHVAVLATKATLDGTLLNQVITDVALPSRTQVTKYFDPQLVPWVESGMPEMSEVAQRLRQQLQHFAHAKVDYLVLGCTHYPFFKEFLVNEIQSKQFAIQVVDSGQAIATRVQSLLAEKKLLAQKASLATCHNRPPLIFYASRYDERLDKLVTRLLGEQVKIEYML